MLSQSPLLTHACATDIAQPSLVWYVMKQLILPPDINEVTMQKEILTPPKVAPATLDQGCAWLEEMQHRLNLCIKTKQNVHPRTIVAYVNETLSGITQYYRTVGNIWDSLYGKHQLRESNIIFDVGYLVKGYTLGIYLLVFWPFKLQPLSVSVFPPLCLVCQPTSISFSLALRRWGDANHVMVCISPCVSSSCTRSRSSTRSSSSSSTSRSPPPEDLIGFVFWCFVRVRGFLAFV